MSASAPVFLVNGVYAIRLYATDADDPGRLRGCLEHVFSGRCHDFDSEEALVAWLRHERRRDALVQAHQRSEPPHD